jgi:hypothetical protein
LDRDPGDFSGYRPARQSKRIPVVLSRQECKFRLPDPGALGFGTFKCIALWYLSGFYMKKIIKYAFPNSEY